MRRTIILAAALAIILLGLWGTAVIYFDESRLKGVVADRLSAELGRRVEIAGVLRFRLFPRPRVQAENVLVFDPEGLDGQPAIVVERVSMRVRIQPLLRGEFAPGEMHLAGIVVDVARLQGGGDASDPLSSIRSSASLLTDRSLRLEDLTVVLSRPGGGAVDTIAIDFIELDRFSLDRTMAFRFRGDLGAPPILENLHVDGLLHVPARRESALRLRDMRLQARLPALGQAISLTGDLTATGGDLVRVALAGGRLRVGDQGYDLSFNYHGGAPPSLDLLVSGSELDWLPLETMALEILGSGATTALAGLSRRVDLRSQLQFERLSVGPFRLSGARIDLRSEPDGMGVGLAAMFPGGLAEASGVLSRDRPSSLVVDASVAELGGLLDSLDLPQVAGGSGEASLTLEWTAEPQGSFALEGRFALWDGYWRVARGDGEPARRDFDRFSGDIRLTPGYLEFPGFELSGGELAGVGWAAIDLPAEVLGGEIRASGPDDEVLELSGTLSRPRLAPRAPDTAGEEQQNEESGSAENGAAGDGTDESESGR